MSKLSFINSDDEHNQVLYELRLLDDDDDWNLFCKMRDEDVEIDTATYLRYMALVKREVPKE